jgi:hypothetical protein
MLLHHPFRVVLNLDRLTADIYRDAHALPAVVDGIVVAVQPLVYVGSVLCGRGGTPSLVQTLVQALALENAGLPMTDEHAKTLQAFNEWLRRPGIGENCAWNPSF